MNLVSLCEQKYLQKHPFITPYHFELLIKSSLSGLHKEIDSFQYDPSLQNPLSQQEATGYGIVRLLVLSAFINGPKDYIYLHLHSDLEQGEVVCFKDEQVAKNYFSTQKYLLLGMMNTA